MATITCSVGNGGVNQAADVTVVQGLLNRCMGLLIPVRSIKADGDCGPLTLGAILEFQRRVMQLKSPDGRVDPGKPTFLKLNELASKPARQQPVRPDLASRLLLLVQSAAQVVMDKMQWLVGASKPEVTLKESDYSTAATKLGVEVAVIKAVARVESYGGGFLEGGKPKILFEGHIFSRETKGKYDKSHPTISYPEWTKVHYIGGAGEYGRLETAMKLDREAALRSASWGKFQIMGFNHKKAGFSSVDPFVDAMKKTEAEHLMAFVNFVEAEGLSGSLKSKDWAKFAKKYNGPDYAKNKYDVLLAQAYEVYAAAK